MRPIYVLPLLIALAGPPSVIAETGEYAHAAAIDAVFAEWDKKDSPGCVVGVFRQGKIVHARGYGMADLEHDVPITPKTVFYIGSTSKQFVAMAVALLAEEDKLSLDDDIRIHLPEIPDYGEPITIRHLIHHTSGIRDYLTLWSLAGRDALAGLSDTAVRAMIARQEALNFPPGERHLYSNSCYFLLSEIVKSASGKSLREYAEEKIFEPLGMTSSHFHDDVGHLIKDRAFSYRPGTDDDYVNIINRFALVGSGGLYTTVGDLFRWDSNFYSNVLGEDKQDLIDLVHQNGTLDDGSEVNYAFALVHGNHRGLPTVQHGGALAGYRSQLVRFPDQQTSVAVLANFGNMNASRLALKVADIVLADDFSESAATTPVTSTQQREEIAIDPGLLDEYVGTYWLSPAFAITISKEGDQLMGQATGQPKFPLFPESETKFFLKVVDAQVSFQSDESGRVHQLTLHQGGRDQPGKKEDEAAAPVTDTELSGVYHSDELETTYRITAEPNRLQVEVGSPAAPVVTYARMDEDHYAGPGGTLTVERDEEGEVTAIVLDAGRVTNIRFRKE